METTFAHPYFLLLLLFIPLMIWYRQRRQDKFEATLYLSNADFSQLPNYRVSWKTKIRPFLYLLPIAALALLIVALARPQNRFAEEKINAEGIDIILSLDISGSMLARDFEPDRLEAAKEVALEFIKNRPYDRIGLVLFAGESFTQCPATTDHKVLESLLQKVNSGIIADGTAIGMGLATAVTRLQDSDAKSKVIILLTDGVNNSGFIDPLTAAETAQRFGIKAYTVGVGTEGFAPFPVQGAFGIVYQQVEVKIDEKLLQQIAQLTDGKYFRATDKQSLRKVYAEIDQLEKSKIEVSSVSRYAECFYPWAQGAVLLLLLSLILHNSLFRGLD